LDAPTAGNVVTVCQDIHTVYGQEDKNKLDYAEQGVIPGQCEGANDVANNNSNANNKQN
jgi:hypothetical protein